MFVVCSELPGDTQFYARRNAERPVPHSPGTSVSHFECDVQTFLLKMLKKIHLWHVLN